MAGRPGRVYATAIIAAELCGARSREQRRGLVRLFRGLVTQHPHAPAYRLVEIAKRDADLVGVLGYDPFGSVPPREE